MCSVPFNSIRPLAVNVVFHYFVVKCSHLCVTKHTCDLNLLLLISTKRLRDAFISNINF